MPTNFLFLYSFPRPLWVCLLFGRILPRSSMKMNYRAVSRIETPKKYAASPAFYICYKRRMRGKSRFQLLLQIKKAGQTAGYLHPAKAGLIKKRLWHVICTQMDRNNIMATIKTPSGLGIHYFSDDRHYRSKDLELWIPELQSMDFHWLILTGSLSCAIPEDFLKTLTDAGIEPVLLLDQEPIRPPLEVAGSIFRSYHRAGVRFIAPFPSPNLNLSWEGVDERGFSPVEQFLQVFPPVAENILSEGMTPVFPMLDPKGNYWSLAFLEGFLSGMDRIGKGDLSRKLALAVDFSARNRPLDWGAGGPAAWPEARPYLTPPGSQDHLGFQGYLWVDDVVRRTLGTSLPLIGLRAGAKVGDLSDPDFPPVDPIRHAEVNLQVAQIATGARLSAPVLCLCFWLLAAEDGGMEAAEAWFRNDGSTLPIVDSLKRRSLAKNLHRSPVMQKSFRHYLLLPQDPGSLTGSAWESLRNYLLAFQPVCGFSIEEACQAEKVTILGSIPSTIAACRLQDSGCQVDYLAADRI
jgi:hypothetical protein